MDPNGRDAEETAAREAKAAQELEELHKMLPKFLQLMKSRGYPGTERVKGLWPLARRGWIIRRWYDTRLIWGTEVTSEHGEMLCTDGLMYRVDPVDEKKWKAKSDGYSVDADWSAVLSFLRGQLK